MSTSNISQYKKLLNLDPKTEFLPIVHEDAMVAIVYKILEPGNSPYILKICERPNDFHREIFFLEYFAKSLPVPRIIKTVAAGKNISSAILMHYLPGNLLKTTDLNHTLAHHIGAVLAQIHSNSTQGFGDLSQPDQLTTDPCFHFTQKFTEGIAECKNHLPTALIKKCSAYYEANRQALTAVDGPCMIHRDFRPNNIIVQNHELQGIIDWSSGRASFAEDDFCPIEHEEWLGFSTYKKSFLTGYASIRPVPNLSKIMPLLRLNRAIAVIGFTVKRGTWNGINARTYQFNHEFLKNFFVTNKK
jgi:Ser/Thr protein kinase RdoA (MazF antagonist)